MYKQNVNIGTQIENNFSICIITRLKSALKFYADAQLCEYLEIAPSVLSNWKSRDAINLRDVFTICEKRNAGIDYTWLVTGRVSTIGAVVGEGLKEENALLKELCDTQRKLLDAYELRLKKGK